MVEKYRLRKIKHKQMSREWAEIFRDFLEQVGRLKGEILELTHQQRIK